MITIDRHGTRLRVFNRTEVRLPAALRLVLAPARQHAWSGLLFWRGAPRDEWAVVLDAGTPRDWCRVSHLGDDPPGRLGDLKVLPGVDTADVAELVAAWLRGEPTITAPTV